jgi:RecA/RadA recombinase
MKAIIKKKSEAAKLTKKKSNEVRDFVESSCQMDLAFVTRKVSLDKVVSTGSTLLDLAISGKRIRGGGIPGGVLMEVFGRSQAGKTAVLAEIMASVQARGGEADVEDPEARLDQEYSRIYGMEIDKDHYCRPDTVEEIFENAQSWKPKNPKVINARGTDSIAALSTELEMSPKGDKMGMKRGKEFSAGFRKTARIIANNNWLWVLTNQVRQGDYGETTPGGMATAFYASIRVRLRHKEDIVKAIKLSDDNEEGAELSKKEKKEKTAKNEFKKVIGIMSEAFVVKSVDDPFRTAPIYILFGYGIDDIRGNLQYIKDMTNASVYVCPDGKTYKSLNMAISYFHYKDENGQLVEKRELVDALKEQTIDLWEAIEARFNLNRPAKRRE